VLLDLLEKGFGTRMGDGAQVLNQLSLGHADPGVGDGDRVCLVVGGDDDLQGPFRFENGGLGGLPQELELLVGISRVRNEFANENLFIGVKRMDDDLEKLGDLCLESVVLRLGHRNLHPTRTASLLERGLQPMSAPRQNS
jgi:hypothetical protein